MSENSRDVTRSEQTMPTTDQPLHGARRRTFGPLVATLLLLAVIAGVFLLLMTTGGGPSAPST